jgi:hypothetical protein
MQCTRFVIFAVAGALGVALASEPADARHAPRLKRAGAGGRTLALIVGPGHVYGPHYGYPTYPSYWSGPTSGVYVTNPTVCYAPRAYPFLGGWEWQLEYVC